MNGNGGLRRGDLVTVVAPGDYGKPRPALVIQGDVFSHLGSFTVLQLTSDLRDAPPLRVDLVPTRENGLRLHSQIQIDRAVTVPRRRIGQRIGRIDPVTMRAVDRALARFLGPE